MHHHARGLRRINVHALPSTSTPEDRLTRPPIHTVPVYKARSIRRHGGTRNRHITIYCRSKTTGRQKRIGLPSRGFPRQRDGAQLPPEPLTTQQKRDTLGFIAERYGEENSPRMPPGYIGASWNGDTVSLILRQSATSTPLATAFPRTNRVSKADRPA